MKFFNYNFCYAIKYYYIQSILSFYFYSQSLLSLIYLMSYSFDWGCYDSYFNDFSFYSSFSFSILFIFSLRYYFLISFSIYFSYYQKFSYDISNSFRKLSSSPLLFLMLTILLKLLESKTAPYFNYYLIGFWLWMSSFTNNLAFSFSRFLALSTFFPTMS